MNTAQTFADNVDLKELLVIERAKNISLRSELDEVKTDNTRLRSALLQVRWRLTGNWTDELQEKYASRKEAALACVDAVLEGKE